jgi:hypothetical protein
MNDADLKRRIQKLRTRVALDEGPEAAMAERLLGQLLAQHNLPTDFGQEVSRRPVKVHVGMREAMVNLAFALGLQPLHTKATSKYFVEGTARDLDAFETALRSLKKIYNAEYSKAMLRLKSQALGVVESLFGGDDKPPSCPRCGAELRRNNERWHCVCGYVSKKIRTIDIDLEAYLDGRASTDNKLTHVE